MHYYKRNLGDYAKKTGRLTMLQHGAYTLLIDSCYDREKFPTLEQAIEWTWASTEAEIEAVKFVLSRFFTLGKDGEYVQERILAELLDYHSKADKNKTIAIEREAKRRENLTNRVQTVDESPPNHKPITNNHKPSNTATVVAPPDGVSQSVWNDFVKQRKAKKAPVSDTVVTKIRNQAEKAGWSLEDALAEICARGWTGFNADWVKEKQTFAQQAADVARMTTPPPPNQDAALKQIMEDRKKAVPMPAHIKQMIDATLKRA